MSMKIITRQDARDLSLHRYYTGKPCKWGHVVERSTVNGNCTQCDAERFDPEARAERKVREGYIPANLEQYNLKTKTYKGHPLSDIVANRYRGMIVRSTEEYWKKNPSHHGTTVCKLWREDYDSFFKWFLENHVSLDDSIDKDILQRHRHSKVYSPEGCLMVPAEVNSAFWMYPKNPTFPEKKYMGSYSRRTYESVKGKGVSVYYRPTFQVNGKTKGIGSFRTEYEAHCAWMSYKINKFIELSEKYRGEYPTMSNELKSVALEMCIDAAMDRPTEWPRE